MSFSVTGVRRGALLVVEGVDRTGKTTQCKMLVQALQQQENVKAEYFNFPARHTEIGQIINSYLTSKKELSDEAIHLLFSANRWECCKQLKGLLESGTTIVVDRYCYSGVAFSVAKGLNIDWCKGSDVGLPRPDQVFFLTMPSEKLEERNGYGTERYEVPKFQREVLKSFNALKEDNWEVLSADRTIKEIHQDLLKKSIEAIKNVGDKPLSKIWTHQS